MSIDDFDRPQEWSEPDFSMPPALEFDPQLYLADFEEFDMTEEQKLELLRTLWTIMRSFVELGFEIDVSQHDGGDKETE